MCCCQNTPVQTVIVQFVMYVQCAQHYCNTKCVAVRTHRCRPSQYNLLCTFSVHNITVTHNVLLSEHTLTDRHTTICYVRSACNPVRFDHTEPILLCCLIWKKLAANIRCLLLHFHCSFICSSTCFCRNLCLPRRPTDSLKNCLFQPDRSVHVYCLYGNEMELW